ncbi:MAG: DUF6448 family protein [Candidatus Methanospirareceae archaeon]
MPPHCDTLDGPVVMAAKRALETGNVKLILPWVPKKAEAELQGAFERARLVRKASAEAMELADYWFYETAVRLHREGEGAAYTGLKPAGLDWGPVVPRAEKAIEREDAKEVIDFLSHALEVELKKRFTHAMARKKYDENDVGAARAFVQAMLGFVLYSHHLYASVKGGGEHGEEGTGEHEH